MNPAYNKPHDMMVPIGMTVGRGTRWSGPRAGPFRSHRSALVHPRPLRGSPEQDTYGPAAHAYPRRRTSTTSGGRRARRRAQRERRGARGKYREVQDFLERRQVKR
eukprot:4656537-Pyramimonas_sp.AAC.1